MSSPGPVPDPAVIAAAVAQVKEVFATSFIGFAVATTAYGISVLQCYTYFRQLLDTLSTIMTAHALYTYFLGNGLLVSNTLSFYAWQIWTGPSVSLDTFRLLTLCVQISSGLDVTVHLFRFPAVATLATPSVQAVTGPVIGLAACCDIAITIALIFYLYAKRRGALFVMLCNVGIPDRTLWQPFHQLVGKLYVNSIVASLNVRSAVLGKGDPFQASRVVSRSTAGTESTRTVPLSFMGPKKDTTGTFDIGTHDHDSQNRGHEDNKAEIMASTV
ncbi:hypothetical protein B0H14DRAFT_2831393 [Mycena olivaceomarginata]|nr:hypothetical protein B0H14DRAFT_2831393 [Mycena olivaceomarginata]